MKTTTRILGVLFLFMALNTFAQNTTIRATNYDISDNLDLRAVASIFGESTNLEDFERRLNNPSLQISNLDLNNDSQVDYLRVIETIENNVNLIIVQAILGRDMFQDVATLELERNNRYNMVVQIVGNPYFYGNNYIYEPVFVSRPIIFDYFWMPNYRAYCSPWYWNYYPGYYVAWSPFPIFRYRNHIHTYVGFNNVCHYSNFRRYDRAVRLYENRRNNYYERTNPNRSFTQRNANVSNRYELSQIRETRSSNRESVSNTRSSYSRTESPVRVNENNRSNYSRTESPVRTEGSRGNTVRTESPVKANENTRNNYIRTESPVRTEGQGNNRSFSESRSSRSEPSGGSGSGRASSGGRRG